MLSKLLTSAVAAAALSLGAAACSDEGRDTGGAGPQTATAPPADTATAPQATTPSAGRKPITVVGTDFEFSPSNIDVKAGRSTFVLRNQGGAPHALEIEGQSIEEETATIGAGETARVSVDLKPGRYVIYCPVANHRQLGMEGTLTAS